MSNKTKIWLTVATSLILIGCIVFVGVMTVLKWDFGKLSTTKYETHEYEINEDYKNIEIKTKTADVVFIAAEDNKCKVVCYEEKNLNHSVSVKDNTLIIEAEDTRKWYEHIGINFKSPKITVYIPQGEYGGLSIKGNTSDIKIPKDFKFESIDISVNTGDVANSACAEKDIKIKTTTGDIKIKDITSNALNLSVTTGDIAVSDVNCGDLKVKVTTGDTKLTDVKCKNVVSGGNTGSISLKNVIAKEKFSINRTTGDVKFDSSDAAEISVKTDTGDVTGSLLSKKIFICDSNTGKVDVPTEFADYGKCEIKANTGDIIINIK